MNTEKKNQHYIPKFYLRNFSYQGNGNQIGIFNMMNDLYFPTAKLKTQGSKNFFYGTDGIVENKLADIEGELARVIKQIVDTKSVPRKGSKDHLYLIYFVLITDFRNPVWIEKVKNRLFETDKRLLELDSATEVDKLNPKPTHEEVVKLSLSMVLEISNYLTDLDYKILLNDTNKPFLTSDFPIVKYNQFLESKKWPHSKTGYLTVGLQIFVPINSKILLILFDSNIYKIGEKRQTCFLVKNSQDIDAINVLQFVNGFETIFFNEKASEFYVRQLFQKSKQYKKANLVNSELSYVFEDGEDRQKIIESGQKNLLILGSTECETELKIEGLKIHSNGREYKFDKSVDQTRKHPKRLMNMINSR